MPPVVGHIKLNKCTVYIGRPSIWGNPFSHMEGTLAKYKVSSREEAIKKYEEWIRTQPDLLRQIPDLKGQILGCWCHPLPCHGDVLVKLFNEMCDNIKPEEK